MIWPRALAQIAINKSLHNEEGRAAEEGNTAGWKISRLRFFLYCFAGMFLYYVSPGAVWKTPTRTRRPFPDFASSGSPATSSRLSPTSTG